MHCVQCCLDPPRQALITTSRSQDLIAGNPTTKNCTIAHWTYQYDEFTGDPKEYLQWQVSSYYSKTAAGNKWGWVGVAAADAELLRACMLVLGMQCW
jgi:hypothetical protein